MIQMFLKKIEKHKIITETQKFNKLIRKLINKVKIDQIYRPKTHKAGNPMQPITSRIGGASYSLVKIITKLLIPFLGTIK